MGIEFPISVQAILTVGGVAVFATLVAQWLKSYLPDWRYTTLLVLGLALVAAVVAQCIASGWKPTSEGLFVAILIGFFGATLAVYGYESVLNLLGKAGVGPRKN